MYGLGGLGQVEVEKRAKWLKKKIMEVMQEDYGGYGRRKKPGIGRYPMGPTNIDVDNIGSQQW